ncbi:hypothetical protein CEP52_014535 [Fusarium oligoseptatum]|uniref:Uncharacterized protein n=1 Tax=Fusarium oligoseptatum TaxID=2604345 RepID=A0A428SL97_9HYPO|nr:hypothetical protein CEP52_014535 [Fusarium oligoseptatum]
MIPRKASATPSSSRTTPDLSNRKSYSSGLSAASAFSFNTARTSTGSMHRMSGSSSTSRLPAPKHTTVHNPMPADEEEDVPPVPAIPKASVARPQQRREEPEPSAITAITKNTNDPDDSVQELFLLQEPPWRHPRTPFIEEQQLSPSNTSHTYTSRCQFHGLIPCF